MRYCFAVVLAVMLLSGCNNNPYPAEDETQKILYTSFAEAPKTLDPAVAYTTNAQQFIGLIYDTLLEYHYLKRPYELIPGLAQGIPAATELRGGRVEYRFALRQGLMFQDDICFELGSPGLRTREVAAADVIFQLMRIADPDVNSPVTSIFSKISGFDAFARELDSRRRIISGFSDLTVNEQYKLAGGISGARAIDTYALQIILDEPYPQILYWFAMPFTSPLPWEAIVYYDGEGERPHIRDHPVGTGPYKMAVYNKQYRIVVEKNPNWYGVQHPEWRAPGAIYPLEGMPSDGEKGLLNPRYLGRPLPFIDRIEFRREKENIPRFAKFLQGYYDSSGIIRESFDQVIQSDELSPEMAALGMGLEKSVSPTVYYIGFNMTDAVVGDAAGARSRKLRQAISLVIDAEENMRLFTNNRGISAQSPIPLGIFGYDETYRNPYRKVDFERAKQLLVEAGYPAGIDPETGKPLKLSIDSQDPSAAGFVRYQFLVDAWRKIGLNVEIKATNYNQFQEKIRNGAYQIFQWGWSADYPDPENFLFLLISENSRIDFGGENVTNFSDAKYDQLFYEMKDRTNDQRRLELIREMRKILEEERPWIELYHGEDYTLRHSWLLNAKPFGMSYPMMKYFDLDPTLRAERRTAWNKPILWPAYVIAGLAIFILIPGFATFFRERQ